MFSKNKTVRNLVHGAMLLVAFLATSPAFAVGLQIQAKVFLAEAGTSTPRQLTAAENLEKAVNKMSNRAMYLRTLSSLEDISFDQSNTIVFAVPMDIVKGEIMGMTAFSEANKAKKKT